MSESPRSVLAVVGIEDKKKGKKRTMCQWNIDEMAQLATMAMAN